MCMPRNTTIVCAFGLAILSCVLGLALCFVKSPQARSAQYLQMAREMAMTDPALSYDAALEAVRLNPSSAQAWEILSYRMQQNGEFVLARKARNIAARLQQMPGESFPVYATPAELRLSLLLSSAEGL
jgi:Tfp pilus assembly protein PilF